MDEPKLKKLHWVSDSPLQSTGYSTISRNILNGLSPYYDCSYTAHNLITNKIRKNDITLNDGLQFKFDLYGGGKEPQARDIIEARMRKIRPDYMGFLMDTFHAYPWVMSKNFSPAKSFFYFPSDGGGGLPHGCENVLKHFNHCVAMARFGQRQVKKVHDIISDYIPHAVDKDLFKPVNETTKEDLRRNMIVKSVHGALIKGFLVDKFVVGVVARNQGRKMLDQTIKAFKLFSEVAEDAVLYFHTDPNDQAQAFDMVHLIQRHDLQNRVVFSPMKYYDNFDYRDMPGVYQVMDVFFLSTSGEGFGVPIIEAMGCGVPCVVTDYSTTHELLVEDGRCGIPVRFAAELTGNWTVERAIMDKVAGFEALVSLYNSSVTCERYGRVGRGKVESLYNWKVVIEQWRDFLQKI